jgi:hypothetical protein
MIKIPLEDLPTPIKNYIMKQTEQTELHEAMPNTFSITEVLYCLRKTCLKRRAINEIIFQKSKNPDYIPIFKELPLKTAVNFFRGKLWDSHFTSRFRMNQIRGTYRCQNVPLSISGTFDFLDEENGIPIITDLKSPATLFYIKRDGTPSEHYIKQVRFYCYCNAIFKGRIGYFDGSDYLTFPVIISDEEDANLINYIEGRAATLFYWKQTGKLPSKMASTPEFWECKTCEFSDACDEESK